MINSIFFILAVYQSFGSGISLNPDPVTVWNDFKINFHKTFQNGSLESLRFNTFKTNLAFVKRHNIRYSQGLEAYQLGLNRYADLPPPEYGRRLTGFAGFPGASKNFTLFDGQTVGFGALPSTVNWTAKMTNVEDQAQCGSCWAFSAIGAVEGRYAIKYQKVIALSKQNLVDCTLKAPYRNSGCNGGWMHTSFQYIQDNGINTADSYAYTAQTGSSCSYSAANKAPVVVTGYLNIPKGNENALRTAVAAGPVSVAVDASQLSFQLYKSGIYNDAKCNKDKLNHAVIAIGYGVLKGKAYWLIQNSWGTSWGMNGTMMMARNANNKCGVASFASFPTIG